MPKIKPTVSLFSINRGCNSSAIIAAKLVILFVDEVHKIDSYKIGIFAIKP
jgi:hypothetical protein